VTNKTFDIVVWGATGFTGRLVTEYLFKTYGTDGDLKWAVAGRNPAKLTQLNQDIADNTLPQIIADSADEASLRELVASTRAVCTTVGPYALYGTKLVALCAELGTHYCDLTGETPWMRQIIDDYGANAEKSGARIVHNCGFDCIPSDLGTYFVQSEMFKRYGVYATQVKFRVAGTAGGASGGTIASMMNIMEEAKKDPNIFALMADPYALNPLNLPRGEDVGDQTGAQFDPDFRQWTGPFVMAGINTRVVRRSHALMGYPWGSGFRYDESVLTGSGPGGFFKAAMLVAGTAVLMGAMVFGPTRKLLGRMAPAPGEGPSREAIENGYFKIEILALHPTDPNKNIKALATGDRDPGYGATSKMIAESAICLAKDDLDSAAGILTPAVAMGRSLLDRLSRKAGMSFTIVE
jgi:short subunit dehydrogenase-like uncharacterized protein